MYTQHDSSFHSQCLPGSPQSQSPPAQSANPGKDTKETANDEQKPVKGESASESASSAPVAAASSDDGETMEHNPSG